MKKRNLGEITFQAIVTLIAIITIFITVYPLIYILSVSISDISEIVQNNIVFFPKKLNFDAFAKVWSMDNVKRGLVNSIVYTIIGTAINLFLTSTLAYSVSRKKLTGKKILMVMISIPLFFNGGLIPTYMVVYNLGIRDTMWAVILPWAVLSFYLILFKSFFEDIPDEMIESAYIDGANDLVIFFRIVLPMSKTIMASIGLFYAIDNWNNFSNALFYLYDPDKYPLALILRNYLVAENESSQINTTQGRFVAREAIQSAMIVISSLPIMILYPFLQKYFKKGVMLGAIKG